MADALHARSFRNFREKFPVLPERAGSVTRVPR